MTRARLSDFNAYASNQYSQFGEDGIIQEILSRIDLPKVASERYCVEFGAWDGKHLSNTYALISKKNYRSVLIEADPVKYKELCENIPQVNSIKINEFVTFDGNTTLDKLLGRTDIPINFDVLSIDIDGNDYHILSSLNVYKPIIICIEFNPTIPNDVDYIQPRDFTVKHGSSAKSILSLASAKGYALVAATHCNLILLDRTYLPTVGIDVEPSLHQIRSDAEYRRYLFCAQDGTLILDKPLFMPWHNVTIKQDQLQAIPTFLRKFQDDYNPIQRVAMKLLRRFYRLRNR